MTDWGGSVDGVTGATLGRSAFPLNVAGLELNGQSRIPIMGPSGAGKSTLLNILSGATFPMGETAKVAWRFPDGFECGWGATGPSPKDILALRKSYFGYAYQSATLQPQLTVEENLTYPLINAGVSVAQAKENARNAMASIFGDDLDPLLQRFESELSGGERQRVSLLQAMIGDPYVLFADEPTGSLDPETRVDVMGILERWLDAQPDERMLVWVTHHRDDPETTGANARIFVADGQAKMEALT